LNQTDMLHQMCHGVLSNADIKAICKTRGLPSQATTSRSALETLFLTETGLDAAFESLDRREIALLHLLNEAGQPVDVSFFRRLEREEQRRLRYGTFTQRYQDVFTTVKERLVRRGVLLLALGPAGWPTKVQMERWRFALPTRFVPLLPPLVESPRRLAGDQDWRGEVTRARLTSVVGPSASGAGQGGKLEIANRELRLGGQPFRAAALLDWQRLRWQEETSLAKQENHAQPHALSPAEAVLRILGGLNAGDWSDAESLAVPLEIFCGSKVDSRAVCESGWRWGCLARQQGDGRTWYRVASQPPADSVPPTRYLDVLADGTVTVDLEVVPFESLEQLVMISDQQPAPSGSPVLLVTPNLIKLGRTDDGVLSLPLVDWLHKNSPDFRRAIETLRKRRGKTILHENLSVARVSDLALKVAIEKALGDRVVSLGDQFLAFPKESTDDVKRVVTKSGHVVKEVSRREA
jgi:hypothetical protein